MVRLRRAGVLTTLCLLFGGGMAVQGLVASAPARAASGGRGAAVLEMFSTPPVLVRVGERVEIPVDVVCATAFGTPCAARVTIGVRVRGGPWERSTVAAAKGLAFDATAPAARSVADGRASGMVEYFLRAEDLAGRSTELGSKRAPLCFFVTRHLTVARVAAIPFGRVRTGDRVLSLPWGSGVGRIGLQPGLESATLGPSSFDVDGAGRVYVADALQGRVAVFGHGRFLRQTPMALSPEADLAAAASGRVFVADGVRGSVTVREVDPSGRLAGSRVVGSGRSWHITPDDDGASVELLPLDASVPADGGTPATGLPGTGGARLLRIGTERSIRLALAGDGAVRQAVEVTSSRSFGEVALAAADGNGGYLVVVHVWRSSPTAADQYQVIAMRSGRVVKTFAIANTSFAETPPLSRFRLGRDGLLYHMVTTASGVAIERFDLAGGSR
jgi:hypothetical protein